MTTTHTVCRRLAREERGQELIEYAILALFIAVLAVAIFPELRTAMATAFANWGINVYQAWVPCDPGVTPPCP